MGFVKQVYVTEISTKKLHKRRPSKYKVGEFRI
jgi:hypothetical protein